MSGIMKFFGGGKGKEKAPTTGEAIQSLRETEEMLMKKQVRRHAYRLGLSSPFP